MTNRITLLAPLLTTTLLLAVGCTESDTPTFVNDGVDNYAHAEDQSLMDRATAKAKATLEDFKADLASPPSTHFAHAIKKAFDTPAGGHEHMWISDVAWDGTVFTGVINNEPVDTTLVKLGDKITVTPDEISDWMYIDGTGASTGATERQLVVVGGYTMRVLHFEMPAADQAAFEAETGLTVQPIDF